MPLPPDSLWNVVVLRPSSTLAQPRAILATLTQFSALGTEGTCGAVWSLLSFPISKLQWSRGFLVPNLAGCAYVSCPRKQTHTQAFSDSLGWIVLPRDFQQLCFHPRMAVTKRGFAVPINSEEKMKGRASSKLPCGRFPSEASLPPSSPNHETAPVWFPGLCSCSWFYTSSWMQSSISTQYGLYRDGWLNTSEVLLSKLAFMGFPSSYQLFLRCSCGICTLSQQANINAVSCWV